MRLRAAVTLRSVEEFTLTVSLNLRLSTSCRLVLDFTRNAVCVNYVRKRRAQDKQNYLRNKESKRQASRNNYWKNPDRGHLPGRTLLLATGRTLTRVGPLPERPPITVIGRVLSPKGHLPGRPPIPVIGKTLTRVGHLHERPPIPVIGRILSPKGHLPGRPPIPVIGKTLTREGHLPERPPILLIGGTLIRKEQQLA